MIHKFERLTAIGKFRDYQAAGTVSFNKLTVIYAENGSGKTTLAAILRSLVQDKPSMLARRRSTNSTVNQAAQIVQKDASNQNIHHTMRPSGWSNAFPNIEIFDIHFINENIFTGFEFNEDHKRQLHQFVIGAQGVAIRQAIQENKDAKATCRQNIDNLTRDIVQLTGFGLTDAMLNEFLALDNDSEIEQRIADAQMNLMNARANQAIRQLPVLETITLPNTGIDFAKINEDLQKSMDGIRDSVLEAIFEAHSLGLTDRGFLNNQIWLRAGFSFLQSQSRTDYECPLCKQEISLEADIFQAYAQKFNEQFTELVNSLQNHLQTLRSYNAQNSIDAMERTKRANDERIATWQQHLTNEPSINPIVGIELEVIQRLIDQLTQALTNKLSNPGLPLTINESTAVELELKRFNEKVQLYNRQTQNYNDAINTFRSSIQTESTALESFNSANRQKQRFDVVVAQKCTDYQSERQALRVLEQTYPLLIEQQEQAVTTFLATYKSKINYYLETVFHTPFKVDDVRHVAPQGRATASKIGYKLTLHGHDIDFDIEQELNTKDSLSEGDKSTLALAFFLAKLDIDPNLQDKIVVIDDPLSSFDSNRRLYTVQVLNSLRTRVKQLVIFSHNEFFLYDIYKLTDRAERKSLRIANNALLDSSTILDLDLEKLVEHDYFKHIGELRDFLTTADLTKKERILGLIRNVLEAHIKFKFYTQVSGLPENKRTFGNLIDQLVSQGVVFRDQQDHPSIISKLRLLNDVSCKPHHGEATPDYISLGIDPNTISSAQLQSLVSDTFALIDYKL